jgi:CRISPR-associated protein Cas5d
MKVERVSYDVITPSAARAIFDAILWKPAIRWRVQRIEVLAPIRWVSVRRNEVGKVASPRSDGIFIEDDRQQRAGLFLRDVKYRLHADFAMTDKAGPDDSEAKFAEMFRRRAGAGQCFNQPYLGCREFSAAFRLVDPATEPATPISDTRDLGWMLYDLDFTGKEPQPQFFRAQLEQGVIDLRNVEVRQ